MIYICTHTDFEESHIGENYTIAATHPLEKKYQNKVLVADNDWKDLQFAYSEGYVFRVIYEKTKDDWVGICHYRKYFEGEIREELTLPMPMIFNMHQQYASCHNINDLLDCEKIIDKYYPQYHTDYAAIDRLFACNMFVMKREDFEKYYEFVFGVLEKFKEEKGLHTDNDVMEYVKKNVDCYGVKLNVDLHSQQQHNDRYDLLYQSRLLGFLQERLGTIFFLTYFKDKKITYKKVAVGEKIYCY